MDAARVICMADPFSPEAFYTSAHDFARRALDAHNTGTTATSLSSLEQLWSTWQRHAWPSGPPRCWPR
jgi:hypothetical protein